MAELADRTRINSAQARTITGFVERKCCTDAPIAAPQATHVIVVGNEKGGSGKTTIAMHVAVALLKAGQRVGTLISTAIKSLTHYIENRRIWAKHQAIELEMPIDRHIQRAEGAKLDENEAKELVAFEAAIASFDQSIDFLVIDTPAHDSCLMRLGGLNCWTDRAIFEHLLRRTKGN